MIKILIVKVSSLGDVVHTMPVVADILRQHPNAQVDWVVEEMYVDLVRLVKGIHRVFPFALRRWRKHLFSRQVWQEWRALKNQLRAENYDYVIDCQGLIKTAWLAKQTKSRVYGLGNRTNGAYEWPVRLIYDERIAVDPLIHVVARARYLVAKSLGWDPSLLSTMPIAFNLDTEKAVVNLKELDSTYAVLIHATSRADKEWPMQEWLDLGKTLLQKGWKVVLPWGSAKERALSEALAIYLGKGAVVPPKFSLPEVVNLLYRAQLNVGVDTGLTHISAALSRPTVQLYQTFSPTQGVWADCMTYLLSQPGAPIQAKNVMAILPSIGVYFE